MKKSQPTTKEKLTDNKRGIDQQLNNNTRGEEEKK